MRFSILLIILLQACAPSGPPSSAYLPYTLNRPDLRFRLPDKLREISGITMTNDSLLACIEDNRGTIYLLSPRSGQMLDSIVFSGQGDFEDIVYTDEGFYVLRSDGVLFRVKNRRATEYITFLGKDNDAEGMCYDPEGHRLLIALKGQPVKGPRHHKQIYAFDLATHCLLPDPVFTLTPASFSGLSNKEIRFKPSGIALHPLSDELYLISSATNMLIRTDRKGSIKALYPLDKLRFEQPEGIAFSPQGTLFISSEGKKTAPSLQIFPMHE